MPWLQLIRWKNLIIIFLTQLLAWWCVILPESPEVLNPVNFLLLSLSTMLIAAAGYIINDYFDIKIDAINKPDKVVLEKTIPRKQAIIAHAALNTIALILAGYVAARAHHYEWPLLQAACIILLWFYSTHFKRQYMTGNIVVALLTSFTIITLVVYEPVIHDLIHLPGNNYSPSPLPVLVLLVFAYFAFMLTWMREIVKDMEDLGGDAAGGCATIPVKKGLKYARNFTIMLSAWVLLPLAVMAVKLYHYGFTALTADTALLLFTLLNWSIFMFMGQAAKQHYHKASRGLKIIMLMGLCLLVIYHFSIINTAWPK